MRAEISQSISKAVKYIFVIYVAASLIYTARHLYATYSAGTPDINLHHPSLQRDSSPVIEHPIEVSKETRLEKQIVWVNEQGIFSTVLKKYIYVYISLWFLRDLIDVSCRRRSKYARKFHAFQSVF
jgi:hypothetical protein